MFNKINSSSSNEFLPFKMRDLKACLHIEVDQKFEKMESTPVTLLKNRLGTGVFRWIILNFKERLT